MLNDITTTGGYEHFDRTHGPTDGSAVGGYLISGLVRLTSPSAASRCCWIPRWSEIMCGDGEVSGVRLTTDENETLTVVQS